MRSNLVRATAGLPLQPYVLSSCWHNWEMRTQRMSWTLRRTVRKCGERFFGVILWRLLKPPPKNGHEWCCNFCSQFCILLWCLFHPRRGPLNLTVEWEKRESFTFHHSCNLPTSQSSLMIQCSVFIVRRQPSGCCSVKIWMVALDADPRSVSHMYHGNRWICLKAGLKALLGWLGATGSIDPSHWYRGRVHFWDPEIMPIFTPQALPMPSGPAPIQVLSL